MSRKKHTGGVFKGPSLKPGEVPLIASQGVSYVGPSRTGRFCNPPEMQELPAGPGAKVDVIVTTDPEAARHGRAVFADFSQIERRVMAQMGAACGIPEKMLRLAQRPPADVALDHWRKVFDIMLMRVIDKELAYLLSYAGFDAVQTRIDEEGCGAVFAAAKEWPDADD